MSNTELRPQETVCEEEVSPGAHFTEIIEPRDVPLGGVRAMNVRRTIPQRKRTLIGAWCFLDHYGPDEVSNSGGMNVAAHPHTGLQTVSWLFSGEILHRDSAGFEAFVKPGELNLMTAGSGISHSERSTPETKTLHGVQLWVALPEKTRHMPKTFEHFEPPVLELQGGRAQVFMGELFGQKSPVKTHNPLLGAEVFIEPAGQIEFEVNEGFEHGILVDTGEISVTSGHLENQVKKDELLYSSPGVNSMRIRAGQDGARLIIIGGEPFGEQIVMWWNFIGRNHDEIDRFRAEWQQEIGGPVGPHEVGPDVRVVGPREGSVGGVSAIRYGLPENEPEPPLPAPPMPLAKLRPRG